MTDNDDNSSTTTDKPAINKRKRRSRDQPGLRKSTLTDVAKYAAVSIATVSRCVSDRDKVTPELRARVDRAIEALNYTPHGVARALRRQRTGTIGVVVPTLDIGSFASGVQALQERLSSTHHIPILASSNFDRAQELMNVQSLVQHGIDGIMLVGVDHDPKIYDILERNHIPFVNTWSYDPNSSHPFIGFDNRDAMRRITDYVLSMGHHDVAMIVGGRAQMNDRSQARIQGFHDAHTARDLSVPPSRVIEVPYDMASGRIILRQLMNEPAPPTAIVCGSDLFAIGALLECRRLGIEVPEQLSITGFDDLEIAAHYSPALTTVHVPAQKMGTLAAEYLLARIEGRAAFDQITLECNLILRETVAAQ